MIFVGLDISLRHTGFVALNSDGEVLTHAVIGMSDRQRPCKTVVQRISYYAEVGNIIRKAVVDLDDEVAIGVEGYSMHGAGNLTIAPELGGIVRLGLLGFDLIHEVPPTSLKKFATGKGNATKDIVMKEVLRRWGFNTDDNNEADAYVLARMVRAHYVGEEGLMVAQGQALAGVFGG